MSLSLRDRIAVAVYPERVVWLRVGKGGRVLSKGSVACDPAGPDWRAALAALPQALRDAGAAGTRVAVLLSNRLVRYAIVPNPDSARSLPELDRLARHPFERAHGDAVGGWEIRLSDAAPGRSALASAVDRELLAALRETVKDSGGHLVAIRPYLMTAFNRLAGRSSGAGFFVMMEPGRSCQLAWQDGGWLAVQQGHWADATGKPLAGILHRLVMETGLETVRSCCLYMSEVDVPVSPDGDWEIETVRPVWPEGLIPAHDRRFAGAMLALD